MTVWRVVASMAVMVRLSVVVNGLSLVPHPGRSLFFRAPERSMLRFLIVRFGLFDEFPFDSPRISFVDPKYNNAFK